MSTANAIQLATNIQSKVGSSLLSVNSMLPPPEAAAATLQAGGGSLGVFLLQDLMFLQDKTYQCVEKVANILQSQLDLAEEKDRRERDQAAELAKEKKRMGGPPIQDGAAGAGKKLNDNLDDIEDAIDKGTFSDLLGTGLTAALLTPQFLKNVGSALGKKLLKGTMYAAIAGFIADPIIDYVENEFDLELDEDAKKEIKLGMIGAGVGFGLAGIPGAIIGATAGMMAKVGLYVTGQLDAEEISDANFAGTAIGGAAGFMFGTAKLAKYIQGGGFASIGATTKLGVAMGSLPVIIGVGAAVALGVGAMYLAKKVDEYQELTLNKLEKTTEKLDREMGEWAAREEEGLFERMGINLGRLSALGEAKVATAEALEQMGQDKDKFMADDAMQSKLTSLSDTMLNYSDEALKTIMLDRTKANNFFDTVESIKGIAAQGGFGENSQMIFQQMTAFSDRVQNTAKKLLDEGVKGGVISIVAKNNLARGGDNVEKMAPLIPRVDQLMKEKAEAEEILRLAKLSETAENEEQRKTIRGALLDAFSIRDTEIEQARRDAQKKLTSINSQLNKASDTLQGLGVNFTYDDLKELYKDDKGALQLLIQRSVNQSGADFLEATKTQGSEVSITPITINGGDTNSQAIMKEETYIKNLDTQGDPYYSREAYVHGAY
jgi:hypothetical protein